MQELHLVIANKNYSSWSMRPWLVLAANGLPFRETVILLDQPDTALRIAEHSRAGKVPVLHHGDVTVWESLAIIEYLAEIFPNANIWPTYAKHRAVARAARRAAAWWQTFHLQLELRRERCALAVT